ncbi:FKBP-type peptidyl-prolyl cis-trans isomerase [Cellulophaga sp. BC115SP]|uniref:FKBP-type peptidyl-prolyl cis-trans isomerase n=1 Tax=Cellulophaga sp. BC115SP TaxID=2683263 RepID=UPI001411D816|nr:FKBP-type peptidyl-prolyl cis-trans isomerase [Cellulophaga sp. BC115SP]NBB27731.1 hypothetical protein [Cellulophaga sp. BC115SP]
MKKLFWLLTIGYAFLMTSCMSNGDPDPAATEKLKQNEAAVKKYITDNNLAVQQHSSGFYFQINNSNPSGRVPVVGDLSSINFVIKNLAGTIVDSSRVNQKIAYDYIFGAYNSVFNYPLSIMRVGDKGKFIFPQLQSNGDPVIIEIELLNTLTENENIDKYIATKYPQLSFTKTSTDLRFAITSANPSGESLTSGKKVSLKYTGKLLFEMRKVDANNKLYYDAQFDANTMDFTVGANLTIRGFEEGVARMKVGEKAVFIFPSNIGYSSGGSVNQTTGVYVIPPYASLQFEVEVVSVK